MSMIPGRIVIANFQTGLEKDRTPFLINNDSFPVLQNAISWRGRLIKKPGTTLVGRLRRDLLDQSLGSLGNGATNPISLNIFSLLTLSGNIVPGTVEITVAAPGSSTFSDNGDTTFSVTGNGDSTGSFINYATGDVTLNFTAPIAASDATVSFGYYTCLPVMGLQDFETTTLNFPTLVAFDTVYSYQFDQALNIFFDVSFYKITDNPVIWSGQDYQQFFSCNYQNALWVTNGKPGLHFLSITDLANQMSTTITMTLESGGSPFTTLIVGDRLWFNEVEGNTITNLNLATGTVSNIAGAAAGIYVVTFPSTVTINTWTPNTGIAQMLTNSLTGEDGIRWYDGNGSNQGWVNFSPPLSNETNPEYLAGCLAILPFKDRLLCFAPITIQSNGTTIIYEDQIDFSQNGTPFYTSLVPTGVTAPTTSDAWYQNVVGKGGFIAAGIQQSIVAVGNNEDVLIVSFELRKTKLVYTSNDLIPFVFLTINSELGAESTFSQISIDTGDISFGQYGIAMTTQTSAQRIDLITPDNIFSVQQLLNGVERVNGIRDYRNEWIYWSFPFIQNPWKFPTQTLVYNYRDNTWAIQIENYTHHGNFRRSQSYTWATLPYESWAQWNVPWNFGQDSARYPNIIGGNQQGYVLELIPDNAAEDPSGFINNITVSSNQIIVNSPDHCLLQGDYIYISGCLGLTVDAGNPNNTVRRVSLISTGSPFPDEFDNDNFLIDNQSTAANPTPLFPSGTYLGGGQFRRLTVPFIQTKQFNPGWAGARKTRIGTQRYLLGTTSDGEITTNIYLSMDAATPWNNPPIVPSINTVNSSLIFSNIVLTRPESLYIPYSNLSVGNIGNGILTTINLNLFSLLGLSNGEIISGSVYLIVESPGTATFADDGDGGFNVTGLGVVFGSSINYFTGSVTLVFSSAIASSAATCSLYFSPFDNLESGQAQIWHRSSTSLLGDTVQIGFTLSDEQMRDPTLTIQSSPISIHAITLDVYPGANLV